MHNVPAPGDDVLQQSAEEPKVSSSSTVGTPSDTPSTAPVKLRITALPSEREISARHLVISFLAVIAVDVIAPVVVYFILKSYMKQYWALVLGGVPALLSVIIKIIWRRSVDWAGLLVFVAFGISAIVAATTHSARLLVLEKSLVTSVLGLIFLLTLIPVPFRFHGKSTYLRPFIFYIIRQLLPLGSVLAEPEEVHQKYVAKVEAAVDPATMAPSLTTDALAKAPDPLDDVERQSPHTAATPIPQPPELVTTKGPGWAGLESYVPQEKWDVLWTTSRPVRRDFRALTVLWGVLLLVEFAGRLIMVLAATNVSTDNLVLYANIFFGVVLVVGVLLTIWYGVGMRRRVMLEIASWNLDAGGGVVREHSAVLTPEVSTAEDRV